MAQDEQRTVVVGAGPAGLAVALRLAAGGREVLLLDSGERLGTELDEAPTGPAAATGDELVAGTHLYRPGHMERVRARGLGGTAQRWVVRARPGGEPLVRLVRPEPPDLAAVPVQDVPAWPVDAATLEPYLAQAAGFLGVAPDGDEVDRSDPGVLDVAGTCLVPRRFAFGDAATVVELRVAEVLADPRVEVRRDTTVVGLEVDPAAGRVVGLRLAGPAGHAYLRTGATVVLALGAWETTRLLLAAVAEGQLPDTHDVLGRWIMDHPHGRFGVVRDGPPAEEFGGFHDFHEHRGRPALGHYRLDPEVAHAEGLLASSLHFSGEPAVVASRTVVAAGRLARRRSGVPVDWSDLVQVATHPVDVVHYAALRRKLVVRHNEMVGGWSDPAVAFHPVGAYTVHAMLEQRPSADNRITLQDTRDRYGVPRMRVGWSWTRSDLASYWRTVDLVGAALARTGVGEFVDAAALGTPRVPRMATGAHQLGGTRMCADPAGGVVDEDLRHHQVENLRVAGSGVFPSAAGYVNPTWMLVALALRLADDLADDPGRVPG